jgi:uncharacterized protein DUF262
VSAKPFNIETMRGSTVAKLFDLKGAIDLSPMYQRVSDVWGTPKRQLFIDSLLNDFDVPKLYFHELGWEAPRSKKYRFAVIDGKQRLEAIWGFMTGEFPLSEEFEYLEDPGCKAASLYYADLALQFPSIKNKFDRVTLPVVVVQTDDLEMIEEMFSRLNEAVPLNAPEKRNSLGGPLPPQVRKLAQAAFFLESLPFVNGRYRYLDLATKFLYLEHRNGVADTKKRSLDDFVRQFKEEDRSADAKVLFDRASAVTESMSSVFAAKDPLLRSVGMVVVYYLLFRGVTSGEFDAKRATRDRLQQFEDERLEVRAQFRSYQERALRGEAGASEPKWAENEFVEFDRLMQSPNDSGAIAFRVEVLKKFLSSRARHR